MPASAPANQHRQDDIAFFTHSAVLCRIAVQSRCLYLITEFCFFKNDPNNDCNYYRHRYRDRRTFAAEDLVQSETRKQSGTVAAHKREGVLVSDRAKILKHRIHRIKAYPIQHYAGNDLVNVAIRLKRTRNAAKQRTCGSRRKQAYIPRQFKPERAIQCGTRRREHTVPPRRC